MTVFHFTELVNDPLADVVSAALGVDADHKFAQNDVGKGVAMGAASNYVPLAEDDEIEGIVTSVEPFTVNDGFSFGAVQKNKRAMAVVGANQGATPMAPLDLVVGDAPVALGTAGRITVKTGAPTVHIWRCIRLVSGTGVAGDTVLIERV